VNIFIEDMPLQHVKLGPYYKKIVVTKLD